MQGLFEEGEDYVLVRGDIVELDDRTFFIDSGAIGLFSVNDSQRNFLFGYKSGELFGNFFDKEEFFSGRSLEFRALSNSLLRSLPKGEFMQKVKSSEYIDEFIGALIKNISFLVERIDNMGQGQVQQRLVERLIFFAERLGEPRGKKVIIGAPMSHADIATSINSSRETVNRLMKQLERDGVITVKKQTIIINSLESLIRLSDGGQPQNDRSALVFAGLTLVGLEASLSTIQQIIQ